MLFDSIFSKSLASGEDDRAVLVKFFVGEESHDAIEEFGSNEEENPKSKMLVTDDASLNERSISNESSLSYTPPILSMIIVISAIRFSLSEVSLKTLKEESHNAAVVSRVGVQVSGSATVASVLTTRGVELV